MVEHCGRHVFSERQRKASRRTTSEPSERVRDSRGPKSRTPSSECGVSVGTTSLRTNQIRRVGQATETVSGGDIIKAIIYERETTTIVTRYLYFIIRVTYVSQ